MIEVSAAAGSRFGLPSAIVVGCLFYAAAAALGWVAWNVHRAGEEVSTWVEVPAQIERVEIVEHRSGDSASYLLESEYVYSWDGTEYRSDVVSLTGMPGKLEELSAIHDRLAASRDGGVSVSAFVDPDEPAASVLRRDVETGAITVCLTLAAFFIVLPTIVIVAAYVKRPRGYPR